MSLRSTIHIVVASCLMTLQRCAIRLDVMSDPWWERSRPGRQFESSGSSFGREFKGPCDRGHVLKKTPTEGRAVLHSCSMCVESSPVPAAISQTDGLVSGTDWIGASAGGIDLANQGANTPGVDGLTAAHVEEVVGVSGFLDD